MVDQDQIEINAKLLSRLKENVTYSEEPESDDTEEPEIESTEETEETADQNETVEETETDTVTDQETDQETPEKPEVKPNVSNEKPSIFETLRQKTAEDTEKKTFVEKVESFVSTDYDIPDDPQQLSRESLKGKSKTTANIVDLLATFIFCLLTWDFSEENQNRWRLKTDVKKDIATARFNVLIIQKKHSSPTVDFWLLILSTYVPFLFMAMGTVIRKFRKKREEEKEAIQYTSWRKDEPTGEAANPEAGEKKEAQVVELNPELNSKVKIIKTAGRHKNSCDFVTSKKKKPCNCRPAKVA